MKNIMLTLVRREFWEHRALWIAPLGVALLVLLAAVVGHVYLNVDLHTAPLAARQGIFAGAVLALGIPQWVTLSIMLWFYSVDCLYAERRDRSILFWKSLPVSDTSTVLSKFLVAGVIVPFGVYLLVVLTSLLFSAIWALRSLFDPSAIVLWDAGAWWQVQMLEFMGILIAVLWYAPLTAYLLMLSGWARRNVSVWALVPPLVAVIVEQTAFHTHYLLRIFNYRMGGIWQQFRMGQLFIEGTPSGAGTLSSNFLASIHPSAAFANIDLWLGLVATAVFLYVAIRLRRYRDDT